MGGCRRLLRARVDRIHPVVSAGGRKVESAVEGGAGVAVEAIAGDAADSGDVAREAPRREHGGVVGEIERRRIREAQASMTTPGTLITNSAPNNFDGVNAPGFGSFMIRSAAFTAEIAVNA